MFTKCKALPPSSQDVGDYPDPEPSPWPKGCVCVRTREVERETMSCTILASDTDSLVNKKHSPPPTTYTHPKTAPFLPQQSTQFKLLYWAELQYSNTNVTIDPRGRQHKLRSQSYDRISISQIGLQNTSYFQ